MSSLGTWLFLSTPSARRATECFKRRIKPNVFLSTPSARRATIAGKEWGFSLAISIHALREEGDYWDVGGRSAYFKFLSTPSARRATIRQFRRQSC